MLCLWCRKTVSFHQPTISRAEQPHIKGRKLSGYEGISPNIEKVSFIQSAFHLRKLTFQPCMKHLIKYTKRLAYSSCLWLVDFLNHALVTNIYTFSRQHLGVKICFSLTKTPVLYCNVRSNILGKCDELRTKPAGLFEAQFYILLKEASD